MKCPQLAQPYEAGQEGALLREVAVEIREVKRALTLKLGGSTVDSARENCRREGGEWLS